jgi:hypothetical protein
MPSPQTHQPPQFMGPHQQSSPNFQQPQKASPNLQMAYNQPQQQQQQYPSMAPPPNRMLSPQMMMPQHPQNFNASPQQQMQISPNAPQQMQQISPNAQQGYTLQQQAPRQTYGSTLDPSSAAKNSYVGLQE